MSWTVSMIGKPDAVVAELEAESDRQTGQCKLEYDDAKPFLIGLVKQNFSEGDQKPTIQLRASGSGYAREGKQVQRTCSVNLEVSYTKIV